MKNWDINVNKKILIILICTFFIGNIEVNAYTCSTKSTCFNGNSYCYCVDRVKDSSNNNIHDYVGNNHVPLKTITYDGKTYDAYCNQYELLAPNGCDSWEYLSQPIDAGMSYIRNSGLKYLCKERAMTKFMYNYYNQPSRQNYNLNVYPWNDKDLCGANASEIYETAVSKYHKVNAMVNDNLTFSNSSLNFTRDGNNYVAEVTVTAPDGIGGDFDCTANGSGSSVSWTLVSGYSWKYKVTTPVTNSGTSITLTCTATPETFDRHWAYYDCKGYKDSKNIDVGQSLVTDSGTDITVEEEATVSGTTPSEGEVTITKVNSAGNSLINKNISFRIYSSTDCSGNYVDWPFYTGADGTNSITLQAGNYSIKETSTVDPYVLTDECINLGTLSAGGKIEKTVVNKTQCEIDFEADSSIGNRLELYKEYGLNNLLDFNKTASHEACSSHQTNYNPNETCLYTKQVSDNIKNNFSQNNLSDYNETISTSDRVGYCLTNFEVIKKQDIKNGISAGQLVINAQQGSPIVTGKVTKICYIHNDDINNYGRYKVVGESNPNKIIREVSPVNNINDIPKLELKPNMSTTDVTVSPMLLQVCESPDECEEDSIDVSWWYEEEYDYNKVFITSGGNYINYTDYAKTIEIDNVIYRPSNKIMEFKNLVATRTSNNNEFYKIEESIEVDYIAQPVYAYKISGKLPENQSECITDENEVDSKCSLLGYGVISEFIDGLSGKNTFNFKINEGNSNIFNFNENNVCEYTVNPEIIKYDNDTTGDLDLEFRSIDKKDPFDRPTNSNWCDGDNCNSDNNTVNSIIKGRNDSYNSTGAGALYTNQTDGTIKIILTPDIIQEIRDYNNGKGDYEGNPHPYNNYTNYSKDENGNKVISTDFFDKFGIRKKS